MRRRAAALLLATAAASGAVGGARADGGAAEPIVVTDFEKEVLDDYVYAGGSGAERVEATAPAQGHALRWTIQAGAKSSFLYLRMPTPDLAAQHVLRFRIRREGPSPGHLWVRLENATRASLAARVRGAGAEWRTIEIDLARMETEGPFDPTAVVLVDFIVWNPEATAYLLDDVVFAPAPLPPAAAAPAAKTGARGAHRTPVADFEAPESQDFYDAEWSSAERVPAEGKQKGTALRWTLEAAKKTAYLVVYGVPEDVREFRKLRFRVRSEKPLGAPLDVRLETTIEGLLGTEVAVPTPGWKTVELALPDMRTMGNFDPAHVSRISFTVFHCPDATVWIDDVEMEAAPGGWRPTEAEMTVKVFGEDRARKVKKIATKHFDLWTDSAAAVSKFPKGLEDAYDFVRTTLGTPEMEERLPVYIFQNSALYFDFCVRFSGFTKEEAEKTGGHGSAAYFATFYQAPEAPVVVHELTHSIYARTSGVHGGSWFQEGVAMYVENAWQKRSIAETVAPLLRSGQFVHLKEFVALKVLFMENDVKGGPKTAARLYDQAGAFYEFLVRGPAAGYAGPALKALATTPCDDAQRPTLVARLFGRSIEALEQEWLAWGGNPPKRK